MLARARERETHMADIAEVRLQKFLEQLMKIQRRYGSEHKNAKTNRQTEVRELVDRSVEKGDADAD